MVKLHKKSKSRTGQILGAG